MNAPHDPLQTPPFRRPPRIGLSLQGAELLKMGGPEAGGTHHSIVSLPRVGHPRGRNQTDEVPPRWAIPPVYPRVRNQADEEEPSLVRTPDLNLPRWPQTPRARPPFRSQPQVEQRSPRAPRPFTNFSRKSAEQNYREAVELLVRSFPNFTAKERYVMTIMRVTLRLAMAESAQSKRSREIPQKSS
jgi:hypothetical protein